MQSNRVSTLPKVSVLMTIFNASAYLKIAIDSILNQTFGDWELIAVENGSTDTSLSILYGYQDPRVRIFPLAQNIGRTPALRYAFGQARGNYIAILDADDISSPNRFFLQVRFLDRHAEVALVGSWALYINEQGNVFDKFEPPVNENELHDSLGWTNPIVHSSAMFRKQLALEVGGYPEDITWAQDLGLTLALARLGKIAVIGDYLCHLRVFKSSMTRSAKNQLLVASESLMLFKRAADTIRLSANARRLNRRAISIAKIRLGVAEIKSGLIFAGIQMILYGLVSSPSALWGNGPVRRFLGAKF